MSPEEKESIDLWGELFRLLESSCGKRTYHLHGEQSDAVVEWVIEKIRLARADERERCAKVADGLLANYDADEVTPRVALKCAAAAIRATEEKGEGNGRMDTHRDGV